MGMTYEFMVAKKGTIPTVQNFYDTTGWTSVGAEADVNAILAVDPIKNCAKCRHRGCSCCNA